MTNIQEIWKSVIGYEGIYEVSNLGRVKRLSTDNVLKPIDNGKNYLGVGLYKNSIKTRQYIHRLVANAFLENPLKKPHVNHKDGNRINNNLSNLEWVTISENHIHRYKVLKQIGVNNGKSGKLKGNAVKVVCLFNGVPIAIFNSIMHAAKVINVKARTLNDAVLQNKEYIGYKWEVLKTK